MSVDFDVYIDKLKQKDNAAFAEVYEQTKYGVFSVIIAIVRNKADAEDLMQETYIKMLKNINSYQKGRNFNAWLMQIAKNLAIDHYRKYSREQLMDPQDQMYVFDNEQSEQPSDLQITDMIKTLEEDEKQIVLMHIVGNTKFKDIATTIDKPLGTVLWLYNRALKKLKSDLGKETE
ncbi:MAG: RNA polymerase sigma factor [Bacilli bacterium]|nr:RNA polymerase sigma factor [Bacilli bacterium]MBN2696343.1 RNA polymerase sigma factor [Bacilli bacterium]